jgi:molecular chaperone GrpE
MEQEEKNNSQISTDSSKIDTEAEQINEEQLPAQEETVKEFDEKIKQLEKEKEEYLAGWKRAKADLLNYQKETEAKMQNFAMLANSTLVFDLLSIIDSFDLAIAALTERDRETSLGKGYYLVQTQLIDLLRKYGLEMIKVELPALFNPNFHEAISTKICEKQNCDKRDEALIIEVLSKGYLLHNKLLRPSKVRVITH